MYNPAHPRLSSRKLREAVGESMIVVGSDIDRCLIGGTDARAKIDATIGFSEGQYHHLYHREKIVGRR